MESQQSEALDEFPALMTRREVAQLLRVSEASLSRWARAGLGPRCLWLSPTVPRYQRVDVDAFLRRAA